MSDGAQSEARWTAAFTLPPRDEAMRGVEQGLLARLAEVGFSEEAVFAVKLGFQEAIINAFLHGNKSDPEKPVDVRYRVEPEQVVIEVEDRGTGFDPARVPDPTTEENLQKPTGRGILLMRAFMSDVRYFPPGNRVRMTYSRSAGSSESTESTESSAAPSSGG